jgi:hypothetical protein
MEERFVKPLHKIAGGVLAGAALATLFTTGGVLTADTASAHGGCSTQRYRLISDGWFVDTRLVHDGGVWLGRPGASAQTHWYHTEKKFGKDPRWTGSPLVGAGKRSSCHVKAPAQRPIRIRP